MRKILVVATLFLGTLSGLTQPAPRLQSRLGVNTSEKVMNVLKSDGTTDQTRLADLKQISFLALDAGTKGLVVKTLGGGMTAVLFESNPVITISSGRMVVKPSSGNTMRFEITDIEEILFDDDPVSISEPKGYSFVVQDGGAVLRDIPKGVQPRIYSIDGRSLPTPPLQNGELRLSRATLGTGIFIVKVGSVSTKIQF